MIPTLTEFFLSNTEIANAAISFLLICVVAAVYLHIQVTQDAEEAKRRPVREPVVDSTDSFDVLFDKSDFATKQHMLAGTGPHGRHNKSFVINTSIGLAMTFTFPYHPRGYYHVPPIGKIFEIEVLGVYFGDDLPNKGVSHAEAQHEGVRIGGTPLRFDIWEGRYFHFNVKEGTCDRKHRYCTWKYCDTERLLSDRARCNQCILRRYIQEIFPDPKDITAAKTKIEERAAAAAAVIAKSKSDNLARRARERSMDRYFASGG